MADPSWLVWLATGDEGEAPPGSGPDQLSELCSLSFQRARTGPDGSLQNVCKEGHGFRSVARFGWSACILTARSDAAAALTLHRHHQSAHLYLLATEMEGPLRTANAHEGYSRPSAAIRMKQRRSHRLLAARSPRQGFLSRLDSADSTDERVHRAPTRRSRCSGGRSDSLSTDGFSLNSMHSSSASLRWPSTSSSPSASSAAPS